jgi:hypothetical protein
MIIRCLYAMVFLACAVPINAENAETATPTSSTEAPAPFPSLSPSATKYVGQASTGEQTSSAPASVSYHKQWRHAHNRRRVKLHRANNMKPSLLKWSSDLETSAQLYAEKLLTLDGCQIMHGYQGDSYGGENIASNWGAGSSRTPEEILVAWWDEEENLPFGENGHYTQ